MDDELFTLKIHHGGEFLDVPERIYLGGKIDFIDKCDPHKWSLQTLEWIGTTRLGYNNILGWHFKLPMTNTGNGYIQCLTNVDCDLMVKTLPANRVAEVYITHAGNVSKIQNQVSPNANYICEDNGVLIDLEASKDGAYNHIFNSAEVSTNVDDFKLERANYGGDKNSDVYQELEHFEGDEYHINESEEESNGLEIDSGSEWLGIWDNIGKDKATMKPKEKEIMKGSEDKKKNLAGNGEVSVKGRKERKEKKKDKVMEKTKSANFAGLLLEDSSTESENDNISPKYDSDDMWEPTDLLDVNPPNYEPKKSKLNKNKRKKPDEIEASKRKAVEMKKQRREKKKKQIATSEMHDATKLSKKGKLGRCSKCLQTGHNKTTCKKSSNSPNSTTLPQATQTTQDWCQNATSQSHPSKQINFESTYWTGHINEPSKLNPRRPTEDDSNRSQEKEF